MDDMISKLRQPHGERNGHAKLTVKQIREIRAAKGDYRGFQTELAAQYGVTPSLVSMIRSGRIWKHV